MKPAPRLIGRWVLNALILLSLLLAVGAAGMWVRSVFFREDEIRFRVVAGHVVRVYSSGGLVVLRISMEPVGPGLMGPMGVWFSGHPQGEPGWRPVRWGPFVDTIGWWHMVGVRYWLLTLASGAPPALRLIGWHARRRLRLRRARAGLCSACGYDLRASKGACPECGRPITLLQDQAGDARPSAPSRDLPLAALACAAAALWLILLSPMTSNLPLVVELVRRWATGMGAGGASAAVLLPSLLVLLGAILALRRVGRRERPRRGLALAVVSVALSGLALVISLAWSAIFPMG